RSTNGSNRSAHLVLRLPPDRLQAAIDDTVRQGREVSRTIEGEDVTAAHADVNARVAALQTSVARLQDFLSHSGSITDLVTLENDLSQRESTLESTLAQQRALNDQIALSTLTIHLSEAGAKPVAAPAQHAVGFLGALRSGWHGFTATLNWLAALAGYLIPFLPLLLVLALLVVGVGALVRQRQRRRQLRAEAALRTPKPVAAADEGATRP
ncbi:MAG: hypothetical protein JWO63_57, partial [Frankiales bacterium]|nr:hypothetical protein [Frankiales bacterium]